MTKDYDKPQELTCQQPCDSNVGCDECAGYWQRMIADGYWDQQRHCWTDKGWREMVSTKQF